MRKKRKTVEIDRYLQRTVQVGAILKSILMNSNLRGNMIPIPKKESERNSANAEAPYLP
jgi:hypothetical protein